MNSDKNLSSKDIKPFSRTEAQSPQGFQTQQKPFSACFAPGEITPLVFSSVIGHQSLVLASD
jgi:hypothetical protein